MTKNNKKSKKIKDVYTFDDSRKMKDGVLFKRLFKYAIPYWPYFLVVIPTVFISSFFIAYLSTLFGNIMDMVWRWGRRWRNIDKILVSFDENQLASWTQINRLWRLKPRPAASSVNQRKWSSAPVRGGCYSVDNGRELPISYLLYK